MEANAVIIKDVSNMNELRQIIGRVGCTHRFPGSAPRRPHRPGPRRRARQPFCWARLIMVSGEVVVVRKGKAGLGIDGLLEAAPGSDEVPRPAGPRPQRRGLRRQRRRPYDNVTAVCLGTANLRTEL